MLRNISANFAEFGNNSLYSIPSINFQEKKEEHYVRHKKKQLKEQKLKQKPQQRPRSNFL